MKVVTPGELQELLEKTNSRWAVGVCDIGGKPHAIIALLSGEIFGMDVEMLEGVLPNLERALALLKSAPKGGPLC